MNMTEIIGTNAGLIWHALDDATAPMDLKALKTVSKIRTEKEVLLALGWLAKEGKLIIEGDTKNFTVELAR